MPSAKLDWDDMNVGPAQEEGFRVYRSVAPMVLGALPAAIAVLPQDTITYDDLTASTGDNHYIVSAWRDGAERFSDQKMITLTGSLPIYRYWRILVTEQQGDASGRFSASEIEFRDSMGGVDLTDPADAVAKSFKKSFFGGNSGDMAFDDSHSSGTWFTSNGSVYAGGGEWIGWDFGLGSEVAIVEVGVRAIHTQLGLSVKAFTVQHSSDAVTWTDAWSEASIPVWSANEIRTYTA